MYRCILQGRKPATCQFRRCSKCITGGYYPPLRRFCCHNAIKSRRAGACYRVNCTQCKRHEAPNASAFGRNSPGDCFVASASIPPSLPTANPPPNRCPSPLSLRHISPHRGESPFTREAYRLHLLRLPCKGSWRACATEGLRRRRWEERSKKSRRTHRRVSVKQLILRMA